MRTMRTILTSMMLAVLLGVLCLPITAEACGCGILLPHEGSIDVTQERAIIRWDGQTEDIIMALQAQGDAKEAAWIMPVPSVAQVKLGDPEMFTFLQDFTKPEVKHITEIVHSPIPTVGAAPAAVTLIDRREIGLYDVSTLAATDASALTDWLIANGYKFSDATAKILQPYVDQGWYYIAARISPNKVDQVKGELDPLWMTFKSNRVVYPMRPSALSRVPEAVYLYILADHRMDVAGLHTSFAGWISPGDLPTLDHPIERIVDRRYFLTKVETRIANPQAQVKDDYFAKEVKDVEYREVEYVTDVKYVPLEASPKPVQVPAQATAKADTFPGSAIVTPDNFIVLASGFAVLLLGAVVAILARARRKGDTR